MSASGEVVARLRGLAVIPLIEAAKNLQQSDSVEVSNGGQSRELAKVPEADRAEVMAREVANL